MDRFIPKYARVPLIICAVAQFMAYWLPRALPRLPYTVDMATALDRAIVVTPPWIVVYVAAYMYWVLGYIAVARVSPGVCMRFCRADWMGKGVAFLCFVFLPTYLARPEITGGGAFGWMLRAIYTADAPNNLFPSMHCSISWLLARQMGMLDAFRPGAKAASYVLAILICISTLYTGQHVVADVVGGIILAEGSIYLIRKWNRHEVEI